MLATKRFGLETLSIKTLMPLLLLLAASWLMAEQPAESSNAVGTVAPIAMDSRPLDQDRAVTRIAFGSCYAPQLEKPGIWNAIAASAPDLLLLMGDNVYQSEERAEPGLRELREAYAMLAAEPEFAALREQTTILATWDDHDYGLNDAGAEFPQREESEALFETVWPLPAGAWRAESGIYTHITLGPVGRRVQVLMLDTRSFRDRWPEPGAEPSSAASLLGADQWRWLEERLQEPAELRLVVSSIPVLSNRNQGENWARMPDQRRRLMRLLESRAGGDLLVLSGDAHFGALFAATGESGEHLLEVLSSSLNFAISADGRDRLDLQDSARLGEVHFEENFGLLEIDWDKRQMTISLRGHAEAPLLRRDFPLLSDTPIDADP